MPCADSSADKIRVFQIYYNESQIGQLDPDFIPYNNISNPSPQWCEYFVFRKEYHSSPIVAPGEYRGYVSWKFKQKTGLSGAQLIDSIGRNPGYDVYFVNPFLGEMSSYKSVWTQGAIYHPGLTDFTQKIFDKLGYRLQLKEVVNDLSNTAYCNYWVGNAKFWSEYIKFCEPVFHYLENECSGKDLEFLNSQSISNHGVGLRAFIMERLFSTFIISSGKSIRYHRIAQETLVGAPPLLAYFEELKRAAVGLDPSINFSKVFSETDLLLSKYIHLHGAFEKLLHDHHQLSSSLPIRLASRLQRHPLIVRFVRVTVALIRRVKTVFR